MDSVRPESIAVANEAPEFLGCEVEPQAKNLGIVATHHSKNVALVERSASVAYTRRDSHERLTTGSASSRRILTTASAATRKEVAHSGLIGE